RAGTAEQRRSARARRGGLTRHLFLTAKGEAILMSGPSPERLATAYQTAVSALLAERTPEGYWVGELSTSALSTATAVCALALVGQHAPSSGSHGPLIANGLAWLAGHQNPDGGWGDTVKSVSNISTTMLCRAAFHIAGASQEYSACL